MEAELSYAFGVVPDLSITDPRVYGDHPGLRIPSLRIASTTWFGSLNSCRELIRRSRRQMQVVWPEWAYENEGMNIVANAQELTLQAMSTEGSFVMSRFMDEDRNSLYSKKLYTGLRGMLNWLDQHVDQTLAALPPGRELSFLEVALFCLIEHLEFREVLETTSYKRLQSFRAHFGERSSARATVYQVDAT